MRAFFLHKFSFFFLAGSFAHSSLLDFYENFNLKDKVNINKQYIKSLKKQLGSEYLMFKNQIQPRSIIFRVSFSNVDEGIH